MDRDSTSDVSDEGSSSSATAMALAMGFSTFGTQNQPTKKRKFNPSTDAFVEGQALKSIDKGGRKGQGSGGNTMPLGKTRVFGGGSGSGQDVRAGEKEGEREVGKANGDEIDLDDNDEEDGESPGPRYLDTSQPPPAEVEAGEGPRYMDTSEPPPATSSEEAEEMQRRIDTILARIQPGGPMPPVSAPATNMLPPPPTLEDIQRAPGIHSLPQRPVLHDMVGIEGGVRGRGGGRGGGDGRGRGRGQRNEKWYEGYYDRSFNENPWERLEKEKGLEPLGEWPDTENR